MKRLVWATDVHLEFADKATRSLFAKSSYGFAVLEADDGRLQVKFLDTNLVQLYEYSLRK